LKSSKMKDLVLKKKTELEEHRRRAHLIGEEGYAAEFSTEAIEAGAVDPALVLEQIESHIATVKEEAFSRKDILEKVERWLNAYEEEAWLEDYNKGGPSDTQESGEGSYFGKQDPRNGRCFDHENPCLGERKRKGVHI